MSEIEQAVRVFALKGRPGATEMLAGAALGALHMKGILPELPTGLSGPGQMVIIDFVGIAATSSSYLKATVISLIRAGRASTEPPEARTNAGVPPLNIYPLIAHISDDIREEIDDLFTSLGQRLPCLEAKVWTTRTVRKAVLRGYLDPALRETVEALNRQAGRCTAQELAAANPGSGIKETGWNNRLAELHRLRLVRRVKDGRFWLYEPVAQEVLLG